jgi:hypothetical protein
MARPSRTSSIVADTGVGATGLTIDAAIDSYRLSLRAGNKSPATIKTYLAALTRFSRFLAKRGMPRTLRAIRREHGEAFAVALQDAGQRPATVSIAYRSLQPFFKWALGEDEIAASPMERMTPPIVPGALARPQGRPHRQRRVAGASAPRRHSRTAEAPPAPVSPHLRPPLARRRRQRGRPHAPRRLEEPPAAQPLRRLGRGRTGTGSLSPAQPGRPHLRTLQTVDASRRSCKRHHFRWSSQ